MLDTIQSQYKNNEMNVENLQQALNELQENSLIKDILPLMGLD